MIKKYFNILFLLLICFFGIIGCSSKDKIQGNEDYSYPQYVAKCATQDMEDEWIYSLCLYYPKIDKNIKETAQNYNSDNIFSVVFDGYNLKYKKLDGFYIPVRDSDGMIIGQLDAPIPSLSVSEELRDEIKIINDYFNNKKFSSVIDDANLNDLRINKIDKKMLSKLYNDSYNNEPIKLGKFINLPQVDIIIGDKFENLKYSIGYYIEYGKLLKIHIDMIYEDGIYLSDLVCNGDASDKEINQYYELKNIEKYIIDNQDLNISQYKNENMMYLDELKLLLNSIS